MPQISIFDILFYVEIAIAIGLCIFIITSLTNLRHLRRLHSYKLPTTWPRISVLVPARNEENNIAKCISCLLAQDYPDYQLIVLDDNSTDRTLEILQEFAGKDPRLKVIQGKPLPEDWLGKQWACQQLSEAADGELLVFLDADTIPEHDMLRCTAAAMQAEKAALISVLPYQIVKSWPEKLTIPAFYLGLLFGVPIRLTRLLKNPLVFACLGQFLVFKKEAYWAAGGYAAVRQNIVDDLAIGRRINAMRLRYCLLDGYRHISCRMYTNYDQLWHGLTKSTFATFNSSPLFTILSYLTILAVFIGPLAILVSAIFISFPVKVIIMAAIAVSLTLFLWILSLIRFHFPLYLVLSYPASVVFMTIIGIASMVLTLQGKATWKGRVMPKSAKL